MAEDKEKEQKSTKKNTNSSKKTTKNASKRKKKKKLTANEARAKKKQSRVKYQVTMFRKYIDKYVHISPLLSDQIQECAYMKVTLKDVKDSINEHGVTYYHTNKAKETNLTKNPLLSEYKNMAKEYNSMLKILQDSIKDHLPYIDTKKSKKKEDTTTEEVDEFEKFQNEFKE